MAVKVVYKGYTIKENTISGKTKGESYYAWLGISFKGRRILYGTTVEIVKRKINRLIKKGDLIEKYTECQH